jgi:hypothetical protein
MLGMLTRFRELSRGMGGKPTNRNVKTRLRDVGCESVFLHRADSAHALRNVQGKNSSRLSPYRSVSRT